MTRVVFLLAPQAYLLDIAGAADVFLAARSLGLPYELAYFAEEADVPTAEGLPVRASTHAPVLGRDDILVVPGGAGFTPGVAPAMPRGLDLLRLHHSAGGLVASVCAGTVALAEAGLLDGRRCTTHHDLQDDLALRYPATTVVRDVLYVVDGRVASSAGMASGIDLALHLVATAHGPGVAGRIARSLVFYARRNGQQPVTGLLRHRNHLSDLVHRVQDLIETRYAEPLRLSSLARELGCSERTVTRHFLDAVGMTPLRYQQTLRLEHAEHLLADGSSIEAAARSAGFADSRSLRSLRKSKELQHQ
ncbi:DJ-1/PfpI family protein [Amycolatopsis sp. NPDC049253]|uniref:GlxA family transcriptional regulator n=1 Tax=Amycolatopsis sp. NPDC049253 TaxID=3155274 RepID=UPI003427D152